jgi:hypothetical protein
MGFELEAVDVTLRPDILTGKRIYAVPAVEVDGRWHVGHATSQQLAALIRSEAAVPVA